jgi:hypothetical protein
MVYDFNILLDKKIIQSGKQNSFQIVEIPTGNYATIWLKYC